MLLESALVFVCVLLAARALLGARGLPPGPWGCPLLGHLPFVKGSVHLHWQRLARRYGAVFSARLGSQLVVVLSDYATIRDALRRDEFTGRPHDQFTNILGGYGIINSDGKLWKDQRKFLHEKLRHFGMKYVGAGKEVMEKRIMGEVEHALHMLARKRGLPTDLNPVLGQSATNVICALMMSMRFRPEDATFKRFMFLVEEGFRLFGSVAWINFIPSLSFLPGLQTAKKKLAQNRSEMADFFQNSVEKHRETFDPTNIRDLVDSYLLEIHRAEQEDRGQLLFEGKDHDRHLQQILGDLFTAAMETIKTTLQWAVVFMLHHPDVQASVQEELDSVVGRSRLPTLEDLPYLPYTESTLLEVLRRSSIVPMGTTHVVTREVYLKGYRIPKDTHIVPLLHAVHMDPELWDKPEEFQPSRFMNPEGKVVKPEYFLPFGVGRRMCLGYVLARMELFLFFSSLLHTFHLRQPPGDPLPSLIGNAGATVTPESYKVCLVQRFLEGSFDFQNSDSPLFRNVGSH